MIQALSTATANAVEPKMKDEQLSVDTETDSDTSSSYTDDEASPRGMSSPNGLGTGVWTKEEHAKFLEAIKIYANGPWKLVASYVGTRTVRQTMTHAQKYRQKAARRLRGLRTKQALMRMHFGHHVSEESLMQERLRSMGQSNYRCEPIPVSYVNPATASYQRNSFQSELSSEATPWSFPQSTVYPNATMLEVDLLEDLTSSPSLEECATELLKLLF
ncbi:Myb-like protein J [Phytophthora citrophthora]|uniref:Myb-like protein J n=1 Tax=Phytophthora citrophthora TaxID=4793 RepID=A0AAD9GT62_9STRA|nr:Myb-like protein J [Phytophthora citrophthora]